MIFSNPVTW